jgi:hypothetical protein
LSITGVQMGDRSVSAGEGAFRYGDFWRSKRGSLSPVAVVVIPRLVQSNATADSAVIGSARLGDLDELVLDPPKPRFLPMMDGVVRFCRDPILGQSASHRGGAAHNVERSSAQRVSHAANFPSWTSAEA